MSFIAPTPRYEKKTLEIGLKRTQNAKDFKVSLIKLNTKWLPTYMELFNI